MGNGKSIFRIRSILSAKEHSASYLSIFSDSASFKGFILSLAPSSRKQGVANGSLGSNLISKHTPGAIATIRPTSHSCSACGASMTLALDSRSWKNSLMGKYCCTFARYAWWMSRIRKLKKWSRKLFFKEFFCKIVICNPTYVWSHCIPKSVSIRMIVWVEFVSGNESFKYKPSSAVLQLYSWDSSVFSLFSFKMTNFNSGSKWDT